MPGSTSEREIVVARRFDAPRDLVFDAFLDADNIGKWWGPNGFTTTTHSMEPRVGGLWRYTMHAPDGTDYANTIRYLEITRPERIVIDHGGADIDAPDTFRSIISFEINGVGTELTMLTIFPTVEQREENMKFGAVEGGQQTLGRLAEHLNSNKE
jgi:uncharacterized protein YndB with AHSA1/START domain